MPDWSRRRALHALGTTAAVVLAGCSGSGDGFEDPPPEDRGDPVTEYEVRAVRESAAEPLFWRRERTEGEDRVGGGAFLSSTEDVEELAFAGDSDAAGELASFVRETDYESASVLLNSRGVRECYELQLRGVWREEDGVQASFCERLRPADAACDADSEVAVGVAIRLPFAGDDFSGHGSRWSSTCESPPSPVVPDASSGGDGS